MALPLFDRELTYKEIQFVAQAMGLPVLPVLQSRMEEDDGAERPPVKESMLQSVVRMLARASFRMHIAYELQDVMAPMLSMYVFGDHMLAAVYNRRGMRFAEVFSVKDVKRLLIQAFGTFVTEPERAEESAGPEAVLTAGELTDMLVRGTLTEVAVSGEERANLRALETAFAESPRICCVMDDPQSAPAAWYAVKTEQGIYSVYADDEGMAQVTLGSGLPVLDAASRKFIGRYREMLKMLQEIRGEMGK